MTRRHASKALRVAANYIITARYRSEAPFGRMTTRGPSLRFQQWRDSENWDARDS